MEYLIKLNQQEFVTLIHELTALIVKDEKLLKDPTATPNEKDICQHHLDEVKAVRQRVFDAEAFQFGNVGAE